MSKKTDPRIIRTKQFLRSALLDLIIEKDFDTITVQDITAKAMLNRSTFYMHYQNKDDLIQQIMKEVLQDFSAIPRYKSREESQIAYIKRLYTYLFQHVQRNHQFYKVMLGESSLAEFMQQFHARIEAIGLQWMVMRQWGKSSTSPELFMSFISAGFLGMIRWWVARNMPYPPEYMAEQLLRLTLIGIHKDFGVNPDEL